MEMLLLIKDTVATIFTAFAAFLIYVIQSIYFGTIKLHAVLPSKVSKILNISLEAANVVVGVTFVVVILIIVFKKEYIEEFLGLIIKPIVISIIILIVLIKRAFIKKKVIKLSDTRDLSENMNITVRISIAFFVLIQATNLEILNETPKHQEKISIIFPAILFIALYNIYLVATFLVLIETKIIKYVRYTSIYCKKRRNKRFKLQLLYIVSKNKHLPILLASLVTSSVYYTIFLIAKENSIL